MNEESEGREKISEEKKKKPRIAGGMKRVHFWTSQIRGIESTEVALSVRVSEHIRPGVWETDMASSPQLGPISSRILRSK